MNLLNILTAAGTAVLDTLVPGAGNIIAAVNAVLPDDKQLPGKATGNQVSQALDILSPEQRVNVLDKHFKVDISTINARQAALTTMLVQDATSTQTTRPKIALGSFYLLAFLCSVIIIGWFSAIMLHDNDLVKSIVAGWPFVLGIIGPFTALLRAYFGILKTEHRDRLDSVSGQKTGLLATILKNRKQ